MKRFKNILYYADNKDDCKPGLERAVELALRNQAQLTVLGVINRLPRDLEMLVPVALPADLINLATQDLHEQLMRLAGAVRQAGLRLKVEVLCGTPFLEIIRAVLSHAYDLVMLTADGNDLKQPLAGGTCLRLMRKCPCPVWVIRQGPRHKFERILAAVNPDPYDAEHAGVNASVMELAISIARIEGGELRVVHAWDIHEEDALRRWHKHLSAGDVDRIVLETEAAHKLWLNELCEKHELAGTSHNINLLRGEPAEVISDIASKKRIDLIVMGTVGRIGIPGFIIGNTAETVLRHAQCSVLTVKPDGFVSPVKLLESD
jgi:universal stress protein E